MPFIKSLGAQFMQEWKRLLELQYSPSKYKSSLFYVASLTTVKSQLISSVCLLFLSTSTEFPSLFGQSGYRPFEGHLRAWTLILILTPAHCFLEQRCH